MSTPDYWDEAAAALAKRDKVLAKLISHYRGEALATRGDAFYTLARSIAGQQISVKAADSVWRKVTAAVPEMTPEAVVAATPEALRGAGLSQQKIKYMHGIVTHFAAQHARVAQWPELEDEELAGELIALPGIGRWTAEMMLIFHYLRPDVFPVGDLGLRKAIALHYNKGAPVTPAEALALGEKWRPWRTVATWYLWRALDPVPVEY